MTAIQALLMWLCTLGAPAPTDVATAGANQQTQARDETPSRSTARSSSSSRDDSDDSDDSDDDIYNGF